jgi:hypothetical protein
VTESEIILTCVRILGGLPLPALEEALQELADIEKYYRKKGEAEVSGNISGNAAGLPAMVSAAEILDAQKQAPTQ